MRPPPRYRSKRRNPKLRGGPIWTLKPVLVRPLTRPDPTRRPRSGFGLRLNRVERARDRIQDGGYLVEDGGGRCDVLVAERGQPVGPQAVPGLELALEELP